MEHPIERRLASYLLGLWFISARKRQALRSVQRLRRQAPREKRSAASASRRALGDKTQRHNAHGPRPLAADD